MNEGTWFKQISKLYKGLRLMEKNKYIDPKYSTILRDLVYFFSDQYVKYATFLFVRV
jgi:hypothetical protein